MDTIYNDRANIITTSARTDDVVATSGNWNTIYNDRANIITTSARTDDVRDTSGNWNTIYGDRTNLITTSARTDDVVATSGNWNTIYGDRANILTTSANTITNTDDVAILDGRVDVIEPLVPSATGFTGWNSTKSTVDAGASDWDTIYGDRTNIRSVSATVDTSNTAFLTGDTPTLSNDLNAGGNNIRGANLSVCSTTGDLSFSAVAGSNIAILNNLNVNGKQLNNVQTLGGTNTGGANPMVVSSQNNYIIGTDNILVGDTTSNVSSLIPMIHDLASVSATGGNQIDPTSNLNGVVYWSGTGTGLGFGATKSPENDGEVLTMTHGSPSWKQLTQNEILANPLDTSTGLGAGATLVFNTATSTYDNGSHGDISGLGDDDHPQYLLADSSRAASGNLTVDNYDDSPPSNPVALVLKTIDSSPTNDTAIGEIRFSGNNDAPANKVYNRLRGVADDVGAGSEDGSIELRHLTAGSEVVSLTANGVGVTVEESLTVSTCPVPAPVCYAQMDGDGTAAASETKFGAGVTPTTVTDSTGHITWDNTNKEFDISVAGTYHVMATLVINVGTTTLTTIRVKNGATAKNTYTNHGTHAAEDPEEVTIQAAFTCAASDSITVTFQDDGATNINLMAGSSVTVRRLF